MKILWKGTFFTFRGSPETMRKLYLSTKFLHQEIRWNYGILHSVIIIDKVPAMFFDIFKFPGIKIGDFILYVIRVNQVSHNSFKTLIIYNIETTQLICNVNWVTDFSMMVAWVSNGLDYCYYSIVSPRF